MNVNDTNRLVVTSSLADDVWHADPTPGAYEWWYFDALSDDGSEAVFIWFLDNAVSSPRYNKKRNGSSELRFPAVFFAYYRDGKRIFQTYNEFRSTDFHADNISPACSIGTSGFRFEAAPYGSGFSVEIRSPLALGRSLEVNLEWVSIESNFDPNPSTYTYKGDTAEASINRHLWNIVAPRSDVSGRVSVIGRRGRVKDVWHFRGTGYHDHESDRRSFTDTVKERLAGRVHFADSTVVFQKYTENKSESCDKLVVVKDGVMKATDAVFHCHGNAGNMFGIKYPSLLFVENEEGIRLKITPVCVLDVNFYNLRSLSEFTLEMNDQTHTSTGITELTIPKALKYRLHDWVVGRKISKLGKL